MFEAGQTFSQFLDDYYAVGPQGFLQYTGKAPEDIKKVLNLADAWLENQWMKEYNHFSPYSAKDYQPPVPEARLLPIIT